MLPAQIAGLCLAQRHLAQSQQQVNLYMRTATKVKRQHTLVLSLGQRLARDIGVQQNPQDVQRRAYDPFQRPKRGRSRPKISLLVGMLGVSSRQCVRRASCATRLATVT